MNIVANKNILSSLIKESIENKEKKKLENILDSFKKNKILSEAYFAIDNLQYGVVKENLRNYVIDHINILREHRNALSIVKNIKPFQLTPIDNDIEYLSKHSRNAKNYNIWESKIFNIVSHIEKNTELASKNIDKEKILESLKKMPENHKKIVQELASADNKKEFYHNFKSKCLIEINALLEGEENKEDKLILYEVKDKVNELNYNEKGYVKDIVMMNRIVEMIS